MLALISLLHSFIVVLSNLPYLLLDLLTWVHSAQCWSKTYGWKIADGIS